MLLLAFAAVLLLAGLQIGMTTTGLPPERHPWLLCEKDELAQIRERLEREPYRSWRQRLLTTIADPDDDAVAADGGESAKAQRAKALAFAFALSKDRAYADRAAHLLKKARSRARAGEWGGLDDLAVGAAAYATTYDLMAGYLRSDTVLEAKTRTLIADLADELCRARHLWGEERGDTQEIRRCCALGLCALAIADHRPSRNRPGPRQWYGEARDGAVEALARQVCPDGAYAEGPGRHFAAAKLYLPFFAADRHVTGEDLAADHVAKACEWSVRIRMPGGMRPAIDSSALSPSCSYALCDGRCESGLFRWDVATLGAEAGVPDEQLAEALCWYDDDTPTAAPKSPASQAMESSGDIILRSGWGPEDTYLLLRAESGRARTRGGAHEQPDGASIQLCRGDEILALDSGYGGWSHRGATNKGADHSLVLIDGRGPPAKTALGLVFSIGADVETTDLVFDAAVDAARVRRTHDGAVVERTIIFADKRHFIMFDAARAEEGRHDFTWTLHVNAGGTTDGELEIEGNSARVRRPGATLQVVVDSPALDEPRLLLGAGQHYFDEGWPETHAVLQATAADRQRAQFVSVLSPLGPDEAAPSIATTEGSGWVGVEIQGAGDAVFRTGGTKIIGDGRVRTDGFGLYCARDDLAGLRYVLVLGASRIWVDGKPVWRSPKPSTAVWRPA